MRQMAAAGVKRLRLAPHHAIYITNDWVATQPVELETLPAIGYALALTAALFLVTRRR